MTATTTTPSIDRAVVFALGAERYGISLDSVQEVQSIVAFSDAPGGAESVVGMINVRGEIAPVVDLGLAMGFGRTSFSIETPMLICRAEGQVVALLADSVEDVHALPEGSVQPVPALHPFAGRLSGACQIDGSTVYLIDVAALVSDISATEGR